MDRLEGVELIRVWKFVHDPMHMVSYKPLLIQENLCCEEVSGLRLKGVGTAHKNNST